MGSSPRFRPARLAEKLFEIRVRLELSQSQMFRRLDYNQSPLYETYIADFEHGRREPPLPLLLRYARVANVPLEALVDDEMDLPEQLPSQPHRITKRATTRSLRREVLASVSNKTSCPYCGATEGQIKAGYNRAGTQRYRCRACDRHYTPEPAANGYADETRRKAVALYQSGIKNFRRIGRILGVSHQSVASWIEAYLKSQETTAEGNGVEVGRRCCHGVAV